VAICTITGTITRLDGSVVVSQQVMATIKSTQDDQGGQLADGVGVVSDAIEAFTDENGEFEIDLVQGAHVILEIPTINLRKEIVVPNESSADFADLI
jgi:hypothetical protein